MTQAMYRRLLGNDFRRMPGKVRLLHDVTRPCRWRGLADVRRGDSLLLRLLANVLSMPRTGRDQAITVSFEPKDGGEVWTREFPGRRLRSRQWAVDGLLVERIGPASLTMTPHANENGLCLSVAGLRVLGLPMPAFLHPQITTLEGVRDGKYRFEVKAELRPLGLLIAYSGWLTPEDAPVTAMPDRAKETADGRRFDVV